MVGFLTQVFIFGQLGEDFAHGLALEREAVGVVHEPVQDGVGERIVADAGVPLVGRQLADDNRGGLSVAIIHDFHQVVAVRRFQRFQPPVIDDQQLYFGQLPELFAIAAIGLGLGQFQ